jgi:hypothetical protein
MVNFRGVAGSLLYGLEQYIGDWYPVLLTLCNSIMVYLILKVMYRAKLFLKV